MDLDSIWFDGLCKICDSCFSNKRLPSKHCSHSNRNQCVKLPCTWWLLKCSKASRAAVHKCGSKPGTPVIIQHAFSKDYSEGNHPRKIPKGYLRFWPIATCSHWIDVMSLHPRGVAKLNLLWPESMLVQQNHAVAGCLKQKKSCSTFGCLTLMECPVQWDFFRKIAGARGSDSPTCKQATGPQSQCGTDMARPGCWKGGKP